MNELAQHPRLIFEVLVAYWTVSAIVTSMPEPSKSNYWGTWIYGALHLFVGSMKTFADSRLQSLTQTTTVKVEEIKPLPKEEAPHG